MSDQRPTDQRVTSEISEGAAVSEAMDRLRRMPGGVYSDYKGEGFAYACWLRHELHYMEPRDWESNWQPWLFRFLWDVGKR